MSTQGVVFFCIYTQYLISLLVKSNNPLHAIMSRVDHKDAKATNQISTHVTKSMKQAVIDSLDTVTLNRKQKVLPPAAKKSPSYRLEGLI